MGLQGSVVTAIKLHEGHVMGLQGSVVTAIKLHEGAGNGVTGLCGYSY